MMEWLCFLDFMDLTSTDQNSEDPCNKQCIGLPADIDCRNVEVKISQNQNPVSKIIPLNPLNLFRKNFHLV